MVHIILVHYTVPFQMPNKGNETIFSVRFNKFVDFLEREDMQGDHFTKYHQFDISLENIINR